MRNIYVVAAALLVGAVVIAIEESRIATLRSQLTQAQSANREAPRTIERPKNEGGALMAERLATRVKDRSEFVSAEKVTEEADTEGFGHTARKMWSNPAGKSMMSQGVKIGVAMMYGDLIDSLEFTPEEADYFRGLLGKQSADQQELGMKMLGASKEEMSELGKELVQRQKENEEAIKTFLNSPEDYDRYQSYKERLPEKQQMEGLRTAMAGSDVPLDEQTETRLVEAMYRARTQPGVKDFSGAEGIKSLAKEDMVADFERGWEAQQAALRAEVGDFLNEKQQTAFFEYQEQMKEFQLMSIEMGRKMMLKGSEENSADDEL